VTLSSRGLGHRPFTAVTRVRIPLGSRLWLEFIGLATLVGLAVFFVASSWRKWPDPLIDFGAQLYTAWQLSQGAVLYRDVSCLYGPLSQYFNAGLFALFGPGLIVLAIANLAIFALILTVFYIVFRRSWGVVAALVSAAILISVFGFSHFIYGGNYNYAAPYAHETTHGMLISLLLCLVLLRWVEKADVIWSFFAGLLFGFTVVLKPEFMLAGGLLICLAVVARWKYRGAPPARVLFTWATSALLPTALFTCYFSFFMPWNRAMSASSRAWLIALDSSFSADFLEIHHLLGLDRPLGRLLDQALATLLACVVIFVLAVAVMLAERKISKWIVLVEAVLLAAGLGWLGCCVINWIGIGSCLLGLMLIYTFVSLVLFLTRPTPPNQDFGVPLSRLLIAILATALMARMFLNGRIYHYGYYQAALASAIVPAVLIGELPGWLGAGSRGRSVAIIGTLALMMPGVVILAKRSQHALGLKTMAVASGRDRFYSFSPQIDSIGEVIDAVSDVLRKKGAGETLVVLPEGEFINYLARLRNPLPYSTFYAGATENGREEGVVKDLERHPPYWIVLISRDLWGYGIDRYGEKPGSGQEILRWVGENYKQVTSIGGDPLDYRQRGAVVLRRYDSR
jgi:hypothetical protein